MTKNFTQDTEHSIVIPSAQDELNGILHIPKDAVGLVLFAHGSGSSHLSVRNQYVARVLNEAKLATLLFDLLTPEEDAIDNRTREFRFDIDLLATRLINVTHWCLEQLSPYHLEFGYFGASTGGAAAIIAAAKEAKTIKAVVSRGGRPDLAGKFLIDLRAPTLLIVGGLDETVIAMNKTALVQISCIKKLEIVPGATHLFEESGTLDQVAELAKEWFIQYLSTGK
jgi:putative phosphoribosyl transferase